MQAERDIKRGSATPKLVQAEAGSLPKTLVMMDEVHVQRCHAEAFAHAVFHKAYGANLTSFYPLLLGVRHGNGDYAAVAGIRAADSDALFSEHYLDLPVEQVLSADRAGIVEIGNLAPANAGQARWLICTLSAFLIGAGYRHVVFTSVPRLRNAFSRMGLPLTRLVDANSDRLPEEQRADWGSYYDCGPAVYAGDIVAGTPALQKLMASDPGLWRLSQQACQLGQAFNGKAAA